MNTSPSEREEPDDPPRRRLWLLHPSTISLGLVLALLATCAISNVRDRVHRSALAQALTPLDNEWSALREQAAPRMASIQALLTASEPPRELGCSALTGSVPVIHQLLLDELVAGANAPRPGPLWLNSDGWLYLALALTPGQDVEAYRRRNEAVRAAITSPCVGVLATEHAAGAQVVEDRRFAGGEVSGRLRIVCIDAARVACEVAIESRPSIAVSLVQRSARAQVGADASAVTDAAADAYWRALAAAVAGSPGGAQVVRRATVP